MSRYRRIDANNFAIVPEANPPIPIDEEYQSGQRRLTKYERFALRKALERYQPLDEAARQLRCSKEALIAVMMGLANDPYLYQQLRNKFKRLWLHAVRPRPAGAEKPVAEGRDELREIIAEVKEALHEDR
jgi:hypothetical protein